MLRRRAGQGDRCLRDTLIFIEYASGKSCKITLPAILQLSSSPIILLSCCGKCARLSGLSLPVVFCSPGLPSPLSGGWDSAVFLSIKERGQLINLLEYTDAYFLGTNPSKLINENARIRTIPLFGLENEPVTVLLGQQNYTLHRNAQRFVDIFRQVTENI